MVPRTGSFETVLSGTETSIVITYTLLSGFVDVKLRKRIENFCVRHVDTEYSKRGYGVAHSALTLIRRSFNGGTAVYSYMGHRLNEN
jgi:hypothetical protein